MRIGIAVGGSGPVHFRLIEIRQHPPEIPLAKDYPANVTRENLGSLINSSYWEVAPIISADSSTLYFSRQYYPGNVGGAEDWQDIWYTRKQTNGTWGLPQNIGAPLNNDGPNGIVSITPDNNQVLVMNTYNPDGSPKGGRMSRSYRTLSGWTVPTDVAIEDLYNEDRYQEMALDTSGNVLMMTLRRKDSRGERDFYVSFKQPNEKFSAPRWCGPAIGSWGDEA